MQTTEQTNLVEFKELVSKSTATKAVLNYLESRLRHRKNINVTRLYKLINKKYNRRFEEGDVKHTFKAMEDIGVGKFNEKKDYFAFDRDIREVKNMLGMKHIPEVRQRKTRNVINIREVEKQDASNSSNVGNKVLHIRKGKIHIYTQNDISEYELDRLTKLLNSI